MNEPRNLPPLVEAGDDASNELVRLVTWARADVGTEGEVARLEAKLSPMLWPPATSGTSGGAKASAVAGAGMGTVAKVGAIVTGVVVAGAVWMAARHTARTDAARSPGATPTSASVAATADPPSPVAAPVVVAEEAPGGSLPSHERTASSAAPVSEADLLGEAQAALTKDPARAFALAEQHRRKYPSGGLVQEREVIAVDALSRLGRKKDAVARADRFLAAFPGSAYRSKMEGFAASR